VMSENQKDHHRESEDYEGDRAISA
jgi:hypothetical protein